MVRLRVDTTGILVAIIAVLLLGAYVKHDTIDKNTASATPTPDMRSSQKPSEGEVAACSTTPVDYVLVTDRSGSMKDDSKGVLAQQAAKKFIDDIAAQSGAKVGLVSFEDVGAQSTDLNLSTNFSQAKSIIDNYVFTGMTCTRCGMSLAKQQFQNNGRAGARKVAVLLTDGMPWNTDDWYDTDLDEQEVQNIINDAKGYWSSIQMQIFAIGIGTQKFDTFLPDLTKISGGKAYITSTPSGLDSFYDDILANTTTCTAPTPTPTKPAATPTPTVPGPTPTRTPTPTSIPTPTPIPQYTLSGSVYVDANGNGIKDVGESGYQNLTVTRTGASAGSATTAASGAYSFSLVAGNYTVAITVPVGYAATTPASVATTLGPNRTINFGIRQLFSISGNVFLDNNRNGVKDVGESNFAGVTVNRSGASSGSTITDVSGNYAFTSLVSGNYSISLTVPAGYMLTTPSPLARTIGPAAIANFGIASLYSVQGNLFVDGNKDGIKNSGESNYTGAPSITASRGTVTNSVGGSYSIANLTAGSVVTSLTTLPTDYYMTYPQNGPPPSFLTTVGPACTTNGANTASCVNGDIINLDFGISNFYPWVQTTCGNVRVDDGVSSKIPSTAPNPYFIATNSSCTSPGIVFSGDSPYSFGKGQASNRNWIVGGALYPEEYVLKSKSSITTSYDKINAKIQQSDTVPTNLTSVCNVSNCALPANLPSGIYSSAGDVNLQSYTVSASKQYVFVIQGDLVMQGAFLVPLGSASTAIFSVKGDIIVDQNVGSAPTSSQTSLDGIYSTDRSFIVESRGDCTDLRLNIGGALIVNAAITGGSFKNDRDLCSFDGQYPTISLNQRLDMLLFASRFIAKQQFLTNEVAP